MAAFDTKVKTFEDVASRLAAIDQHLKKLNGFLDRFNWKSIERRPEEAGGGRPGGEEAGSRPPSWPP